MKSHYEGLNRIYCILTLNQQPTNQIEVSMLIIVEYRYVKVDYLGNFDFPVIAILDTSQYIRRLTCIFSGVVKEYSLEPMPWLPLTDVRTELQEIRQIC